MIRAKKRVKLDLEEIRKYYRKAVKDGSSAEKLWGYLSSYDGESGPVLAYKASARALMAHHSWNPYNKLKFVQEAMRLFSKAIKVDENQLESRFLRFAVQHYLPDFLNEENQIVPDIAYMLENLGNYQDFGLSHEQAGQIAEFLRVSGRLNPEEKAKLGQHNL